MIIDRLGSRTLYVFLPRYVLCYTAKELQKYTAGDWGQIRHCFPKPMLGVPSP